MISKGPREGAKQKIKDYLSRKPVLMPPALFLLSFSGRKLGRDEVRALFNRHILG